MTYACPQLVRTPRSNERAFTLIEVIIALLLSAIVIAMIFTAVLDASHEATQHSQRTKAQRATTKAVSMLEADLRSAQAPQRGVQYTNGPDGLRRMLLGKENPDLEAHDILHASSNRLVFFAEAENSNAAQPSPNDIECVEWIVMPNGALHRRVYRFSPRCNAAQNGNGAVMNNEIMPAPNQSKTVKGTAVIPDVFTYHLTIQPNAIMSAVLFPECQDQTFGPAELGAGTLTMPQMDAIVSVGLDLRSFVTFRSARGDQTLTSEISLTARQSNEYRYGIGCSA